MTGFSIDSRKLKSGEFFVAILGDSFDGHWFLDEAYKAGAVGAMIQPDIIIFELPILPDDFAIIQVPSTLAAIQKMAAIHRNAMQLPVVGVTGSNGKTSAKELVAAVLGEKFSVQKTKGNLNNHIGVPLSLLALESSHQVGVFELGMNHQGEIAPLAKMIAPRVGIITNIGTAHIEYLGSKEKIAEEKGALAEALPADGCLILDAEDTFCQALSARTSAKKITIGFDRGDVQAKNISSTFEVSEFQLEYNGQSVAVKVPIPGVHMVRNALLGAAAGIAFEMSLEQIAAGIAKAQLPGGRMKIRDVHGVTILDDTYNANPESMQAALAVLGSAPLKPGGRRVAILGMMGELGEHLEAGYAQVAEAAKAAGVNLLVAVGETSASLAKAGNKAKIEKIQSCSTREEAVEFLKGEIAPEDVLLLKGSRASRMELIIEGLQE
ncbi:MAG: UDP-N-acetylmuramoyl-tripeptide--D-alanyl-D-alanine ligase [Verrucomicrobiales bacterium]